MVASILSTAQINPWDSWEGDEEKRPIRSPYSTWQLATEWGRGLSRNDTISPPPLLHPVPTDSSSHRAVHQQADMFV